MLCVTGTNLFYSNNKGLGIFQGANLISYCRTSKCSYQKSAIQKILSTRSEQNKKERILKKKWSEIKDRIRLEKLSPKNLQLYRRTILGHFKPIKTDQLIEKLKVIYSLDNQTKDVSPKPVESITIKSKTSEFSSKEKQSSSPYMSDFLIRNMTDFPLLQTTSNTSLTNVLREEKEEIVDATNFPSVTRILSETMSESSRLRLQMWKNKMIKELGIDGFNKYQEDPDLKIPLVSKIFFEPPRKRKRIVVDLLNKGSKFHGFLRKYLESGDERIVAVDPDVEGCCKSLEKLLPEISNVMMVEEPLHHPILMYKGIVDCVASYRGVPCVIEWKKSEKKKLDLTSTFDAPLQLCAYLGALAWNKNIKNLENGLVVVAYTDGAAANVFSMNLECCHIYWTEWLRRLQSYWATKSSTSVLKAEA